jgi:hypothetical protein
VRTCWSAATFRSSDRWHNIIAFVKDLGSNGLVGLIALGFILWLFSHRSWPDRPTTGLRSSVAIGWGERMKALPTRLRSRGGNDAELLENSKRYLREFVEIGFLACSRSFSCL